MFQSTPPRGGRLSFTNSVQFLLNRTSLREPEFSWLHGPNTILYLPKNHSVHAEIQLREPPRVFLSAWGSR